MKNTPLTAGDREKRNVRKELIVKLAVCLISAFLLSVIIKLSDIKRYQNASDFFSADNFADIAIITALMAILLLTLLSYTFFIRKDLLRDKKVFPVIFTSIIVSYSMCFVFGTIINVYAMPLLLSALLVAGLVDKRTGIITNVLMSQAFFLTFLLSSNGINVIESSASLITSMVAGVFMITYLDRAGTRLKFITLGALIGLVTSIIPVLINLISPVMSFGNVLVYGLWSFVSILLAIALYMLILPIMEFAFKVNTNFRLAEISSFDFPLLKKLAKEAPGTFNHSLVVGNLAELCASAIGENPQLAKVAAYYHDVGKTKNPEYFIENQKGYNPHDDLIPEVSIKMITGHTQEGYKLIKKYRLPDIIANVAREHHGTMPVNYFLYKAQNFTESDLNKKEYSYQDPKPSSKTAAIVMIVDTVEAATRSVSSQLTNYEEYRNLVHKLIKEKADMNQFTDCEITFRDLQLIEDTLVEAIPNMYHSRIQYATNKKG